MKQKGNKNHTMKFPPSTKKNQVRCGVGFLTVYYIYRGIITTTVLTSLQPPSGIFNVMLTWHGNSILSLFCEEILNQIHLYNNIPKKYFSTKIMGLEFRIYGRIPILFQFQLKFLAFLNLWRRNCWLQFLYHKRCIFKD